MGSGQGGGGGGQLRVGPSPEGLLPESLRLSLRRRTWLKLRVVSRLCAPAHTATHTRSPVPTHTHSHSLPKLSVGGKRAPRSSPQPGGRESLMRVRAGSARLGATYSEEGARRRRDREELGELTARTEFLVARMLVGSRGPINQRTPGLAGEKKSGAGMGRAGWGLGRGELSGGGEAGWEEGLGGREEGRRG